MKIWGFREKLDQAKAYLRIASPFFACLCETCRISPSEEIETACVNEKGFIQINPKFLESLTLIQVAVLICHEIMHPAWGIFWRRKSLNHDAVLSNVAHDHVVNLILSSSNPDWSIPGWLCDKKYQDLSYEEVYAKIQRESPSGKSLTCGALGFDAEQTESSLASADEMKEEWRNKVISAYQTAMSMGEVPLGIRRAVSSMLESRIDWRTWLFSHIGDTVSKSKLDWSEPCRRSDNLGFHWPAEKFLGYDVSVAVDTSGSISESELRRASSEIAELAVAAGATCRFIACDASVKSDLALRDFSPEFLIGGGGTNFQPVFDHLEKHPTKLLVYFTDAIGKFPTYEPEFPVVWAIYGDDISSSTPEVPFGDVLRIPTDD
jgi:predicted metal-dependent peptidase